MGLLILGIFLLVYAVVVVYIALAKPERIWKMGKIQGFTSILGDTGAMIFFLVVAAIAAGFGVWLTFIR